MSSRTIARHRKATRALTPLDDFAPTARRGLAVAASSGLALTMIASGANAASSTEVAASAGSLQQTAGLGALTADAREAVAAADSSGTVRRARASPSSAPSSTPLAVTVTAGRLASA